MEAVIDAVYSAIVDIDAFDRLPSILARELNAPAGFFLYGKGSDVAVQSSYNLDLGFIEGYEEHYSQGDLWLGARLSMPTFRAMSLDRFVPTSAWLESEYFNYVVKGIGGYTSCLGVHLKSLDEEGLTIAFQRTAAQDSFGLSEERRLQTLLPHIECMDFTRRRVAPAMSRFRLADAALQMREEAILFCDHRGTVLHMNLAAERLPPRLARVSPSGWLVFRDAEAQAAWTRAAIRAAKRSISSRWRIARGGALPYEVTADPIRSDAAAILVTIHDLERRLHTCLRRAEAKFGFTPSECALAESLIRGRTIADHAALRGTASSTVRFQLRMLLEKSATRRQAELVAVIASI